MPPKLPPKRQWLQPVRSGWEWIKYWNIEAILLFITILIALPICGYLFDISDVRFCVKSLDLNQCYFLRKTAWDWIDSVVIPLSVPITLASLGFLFNQQQQKNLTAKQANEQKEEILQAYFDRISSFLVEHNLFADSKRDLEVSAEIGFSSSKETQEKNKSILEVVRANTLSVLRRFENDSENKGRVLLFLIETGLIGKAKLNLRDANTIGANLSNANLSNFDFTETYFYEVNFSFADLNGVDFRKANLNKANLSDANLSKTNLSDAYLEGAHLRNTYLQGASLRGAKLQGADLRGAYLNNADLTDTYLDGVDLTDTCFHDANFTQAHLIGIDFCNADLSDANFSGANLININFSKAEIAGATFNNARYNRFTTFPSGFSPKANGLDFVDIEFVSSKNHTSN